MRQRQIRHSARAQGSVELSNSKTVVAMVAIAFVIAIGAIAGITANAAIVPSLSSTSTDPSRPLTMLGVALTGMGILLLLGRPVRHL
jgi:hypothetical protein